MESLNAMRAQEGRALAEELARILSRLQEHVRRVILIAATSTARPAFDQKMRELLGDTFNLDRDRILQEHRPTGGNDDIEEELARLRAHIGIFSPAPESRDVDWERAADFMLQEMTREANATYSKTGSIATSQPADNGVGPGGGWKLKRRHDLTNLE